MNTVFYDDKPATMFRLLAIKPFLETLFRLELVTWEEGRDLVFKLENKHYGFPVR